MCAEYQRPHLEYNMSERQMQLSHSGAQYWQALLPQGYAGVRPKQPVLERDNRLTLVTLSSPVWLQIVMLASCRQLFSMFGS